MFFKDIFEECRIIGFSCMSLKYTAPLSSGFPCFQKVSCHSYIFIPPYVMCQVFSLSAFYFSSSLLVFSNLIMLSFSVIFFMFLVLCDLLRFLNLWVSIFTFSKIHLKLFSHYFSNTFSIHSCFFPPLLEHQSHVFGHLKLCHSS